MGAGRYICIFFIISSVLLRIPAFAESSTIEPADQQIGFADSLFQEGDYFRSITEYKRFLFHYPKDSRIEQAAFRICESYFRAKRWPEAEESLSAFVSRYPSSSLISEAIYLKSLAEKNQKKFEAASKTLDELSRMQSGQNRDRALYQQGLIFVERTDWKRARGLFLSVSPESSLYPSARKMAQDLENADHLPTKDPTTAGVLAAVLPGAGHLYMERPRDATVAFLLNASFITAAVQLFRHDNEIAGGIVTFFELGWYAGNIYSAVSSAHKYNVNVKAEFIEKLKQNSALSFVPSGINPRGLMLMYSFIY